MKKEFLRLAQRYQRELRNCLRGKTVWPRRSGGLGREAVKDGLETFELGAIHGKALLAPMLVKDDGRSFDVDRVLDSRKNKRLGLIGMRELVERVGGTFGVDSAPGVGTTLSAMIPLKHAGN